MKCPTCGAYNPAGTPFCIYCGEPIPEGAGDQDAGAGGVSGIGGIDGIGSKGSGTTAEKTVSDGQNSGFAGIDGIGGGDSGSHAGSADPFRRGSNQDLSDGPEEKDTGSSVSGGTGGVAGSGVPGGIGGVAGSGALGGTGGVTGSGTTGIPGYGAAGGAGLGASRNDINDFIAGAGQKGASGVGGSTAASGVGSTGSTGAAGYGGTGTSGAGSTGSTGAAGYGGAGTAGAGSSGSTGAAGYGGTGTTGAGSTGTSGTGSTGSTAAGTKPPVKPASAISYAGNYNPGKLRISAILSLVAAVLYFIYITNPFPISSWGANIKNNFLVLGRILPIFAYAFAAICMFTLAKKGQYKSMVFPLALYALGRFLVMIDVLRVAQGITAESFFRGQILPITGTVLIIMAVTSIARKRLITASMACYYWLMYGLMTFLSIFSMLKGYEGNKFFAALPYLVPVCWSFALAFFCSDRMQ